MARHELRAPRVLGRVRIDQLLPGHLGVVGSEAELPDGEATGLQLRVGRRIEHRRFERKIQLPVAVEVGERLQLLAFAERVAEEVSIVTLDSRPQGRSHANILIVVAPDNHRGP
ncbi:MAG: hypothetical protein EBV06_17245 [Planctomycetia bacterium]|nr:hypothetical protein [Planctomycetia bacterium]